MYNKGLLKVALKIAIVFIFAFPSCNFHSKERESKQNDTIASCNTISLKIDNSDSSKIGYGKADDGFVISIVSLCLRGDFVYLVDEIHKNIKKIDLNTSQVTSSPILSKTKHYKFLNDIGFFDKRIYVSTVGDIVYTLNEDLLETNFFTLPSTNLYPTYIMNSNDDSITLMTQVIDSAYIIHKNNQILNSRKTTEKEGIRLVERNNLSKGILKDKKIDYTKLNNKEYLTIYDKTLILCEPFKYE